MEPTEKEVEVRLRELGVRLASPPTDIDELLRILDQTEIYLSRVEQSPSSSMSDALGPVMNSLITKEFLNHTKADVKVFVAACIHEIIRVTAPDAPYNDVLMKEIFAMIVDAFDKLDDMSGCSYSKRVTILEIMAKVNSCVVMLDLECDDLILHMFKYFLKSIRPDHPTNVFSSMEAIMTLILEESEDISLELLVCLLSNVQKSTKGVIPVACRLAEKVISNCLMKLKPYILVAVQSMGTCLDDFGDIIASICKDSFVTPEHNKADDNKLSERTVSDELGQESEKLDKPVSCLVEVGTLADTTIKVLSNGVMPLGNGHAVIEPIYPELELESSMSNEQCKNVVPIGETNSLSSITEKPANEINFQYIEAKSSSVQLTDAIDSSPVGGDKETSTPTSQRDGLNGQAKILKSDRVPVMVPETKVHLESETDAELQLLAGLVDAIPCFDSAAPAYSSPVSGLPSHFSEMKSISHKPASLACKEIVSEITTMEKEGPTAVVYEHEDQSVASISDGKPLQDSKMSLAENAMTEVAAVGISDGQCLRKQQKEAASVVADANTFENQRVSNLKKPKAEDVADRDSSAEPCLKASRLFSMHLDNIGRKIEVWWPDDERFYTGVIDAFDPVTKKHRVVYDDGDAEILFLRNERWNYIDSKNFEKGQENDIACPESSSQMPNKRKASTRKRNTARDGKSEESGDQNSTFKPRGSPRHTTSELDPSLYDKTSESLVDEETKFDTDKNYSTKFKLNRRFKRKNISTSGGTESVMRSTDGSEGDSFGRKLKIFDKDEGTESDSHKINSPLDENFRSWRKSALKFRVKFSRILHEEALKSPNNGDKGTITESSETNNGLIADTDEELKLNQLSAHGVSNSIMSHIGAPTTANIDQNILVKFDRGSPTKKRHRKASRLSSMHLDNIGRKIEVWWPDDERFYTGVIDAFDPVTKKHRVVYDDGDAEILFLRNERWNYIDSKNFEKGQENDIACPERSSQMPKKRKASSAKRNAARERSVGTPLFIALFYLYIYIYTI
ncbi:uncharacterized protein LOC110027049 isoform X2 [Phalaenopsis equestris]|uniref:uncharacterized protein LOC110027049 isoform X2 n=1 Tax=Phalaenopsis equestris TaxID=78828 RepID=UPI0009E395AF|nr:uncharacterized protein LOC110027049 isoform X2 [Phalaenopsis equestris]